MAGWEIEVDEGCRCELDSEGVVVRGEAEEFTVRKTEGRDGGGLPEETFRSLGVELDERERAAAGDPAENIGEDGGGDPGDDHRRANLEDHPDEREAQGPPVPWRDDPEAPNFPGIEGGVRDPVMVFENEENPGITTNRKTFKHMSGGQVEGIVSCFARVLTMPMK